MIRITKHHKPFRLYRGPLLVICLTLVLMGLISSSAAAEIDSARMGQQREMTPPCGRYHKSSISARACK